MGWNTQWKYSRIAARKDQDIFTQKVIQINNSKQRAVKSNFE